VEILNSSSPPPTYRALAHRNLGLAFAMLFSFASRQAAPSERAAQQIDVVLPSMFQGDASGRLLVFAKPADPSASAPPDEVDISEIHPTDVAVAARDVATFGLDRRVIIDLDQTSIRPFSSLVARDYCGGQ
jgi:hypothetical protein